MYNSIAKFTLSQYSMLVLWAVGLKLASLVFCLALYSLHLCEQNTLVDLFASKGSPQDLQTLSSVLN